MRTAVMAAVLLAPPASAARDDRAAAVLAPLDGLLPQLERVYTELHAAPELSFQERRTAERMAAHLRELGYTVTTGVGGHGVVGVLANGRGPTVMLRTDLDALPVEERTGLPYASRVTATDDAGTTVPVMHACGHDAHMTAWLGTATLLSRARDRWRGTLVLVGQPAEERGSGARAMLDDGLFTRFPRPDAALAIHVSASEPAGRVTYTPGWALASVDSVDVVVHGRGGHGAYPHATVDPVVIAARIVLGLQTIVSREKNPLEPAVITVGSIHGGSKHNVIPDTVTLQLTVRSYTDEVRTLLLRGIERTARAEAAAAGAPREPEVRVSESTPSTRNDPELTSRVTAAVRRVLGEGAVAEQPPVMGGEDFSEYGRAGVPAALVWVGAVEPSKHEASSKPGGPSLPSLHSAEFAPDRVRTLRTAVTAEVAMLLELLARP